MTPIQFVSNMLRTVVGMVTVLNLAGCEDRRITFEKPQRVVATAAPVTPGLDLCTNFVVRLSDGTAFLAGPSGDSLRKVSAKGAVTDMHLNAFGIAKDIHNNVYVHTEGGLIKISANGVIKTLAKKADTPDEDQDGIRSVGRLGSFHAMAVDPKGNVYLQETTMPDASIRKVTPNGTVSTIFKLARIGNYSNNWGTHAFAVDSKGNLFFGARGAVLRIAANGEVSTFAGQESEILGAPHDGTGRNAAFGAEIMDMTADAYDNLYVRVHSGDYFIRKISPSGTVSTLAGKYVKESKASRAIRPGDLVDGDERGNDFHPRSNLDVDAKGNLYFLECELNALRRLTQDGQITTVMRGKLNDSAVPTLSR